MTEAVAAATPICGGSGARCFLSGYPVGCSNGRVVLLAGGGTSGSALPGTGETLPPEAAEAPPPLGVVTTGERWRPETEVVASAFSPQSIAMVCVDEELEVDTAAPEATVKDRGKMICGRK